MPQDSSSPPPQPPDPVVESGQDRWFASLPAGAAAAVCIAVIGLTMLLDWLPAKDTHPPVAPPPGPASGASAPAPAPAPSASATKLSLAADHLFAFDSSDLRLTPDAVDRLQRCLQPASTLLDVRVVGHTDCIGTAAYNDGLSLRRARAMVAYLVSRGAPAASAAASDAGSREARQAEPKRCAPPVSRSAANKAALAKYRRVEVACDHASAPAEGASL